MQKIQDPRTVEIEANLRMEELQNEVNCISRNNTKLRRSNELMKLESWHSEELKQKNLMLENKIIDLEAETSRLKDLVSTKT